MKIKAAGSIFMALDTGRIMLILRSGKSSHPFKWSFVGGKIEKGEKILEGLERELHEEINFNPRNAVKVIPFDHFVSRDQNFEYSSILILTKTEFIPELNHESVGYAWVEPPNWPRPLHPGARACLTNKNLEKNLKEIRQQLR